jgi:hypothetical protein
MSEHNQGEPGDERAQQPYYAPPAGPPGGNLPAPYGSYPVVGGPGQIGSVRSTGLAMFLYVITFGIYGLYWYYVVHDEMKRHKGTGLGGGLALLLAFVVGFVMPYLTSSEAGELYERRGQPKPVSGLTGLWYFPGALLVVGPIVWFVKTNGAINSYWRSVGAL